MAALEVTNSAMADFNAITTLTAKAADSSTANEAQDFKFAPTRVDHKFIIVLENAAADQGTVTYSIAAGGFPQSSAALTGSVAQGVKRAIVLDAKYKKGDGTYVITVTPANGKRLATDHAFKAYALELPH